MDLKRTLEIFFFGEEKKVKYLTPIEKKIYYLEKDINELEILIKKDLKICMKWEKLITLLKEISKDIKEKHDQ